MIYCAPYDWIAWLSGQDAKVLLVALMTEIEHPSSEGMAQQLCKGWRMNAHQAIEAEDWTAVVDGFLEVRVDARLFLLRKNLEGLTHAKDEHHARHETPQPDAAAGAV